MLAQPSFKEKMRLRLKSLEHKYNQYRFNTGETVIADTEYGQVKGAKRKSIYDKHYYSFEKIPYAEPPVNNLRFKAPKPPTPWADPLDCTQMNPKPMQVNFIFKHVEGTEDCLYLNVFTNNLQPKEPRPVMVWIYGGGFVFGEANRDLYSPDLLMNKDIVLITINYRLNVFGFLSLKDPSLNVPGNAGLKDQVMALKWVKNNCARFGGNPDNITVFGQSAGAASTHYMTLTEQTNGLFHRAIMMSGSVLAPWASVSQDNYAYRLAKSCGYSGEDNDKDVLEFLQMSHAKDLVVDDTKLLTAEEQLNGVFFCFGPTVEPYATNDCVVPREPFEMMKTAWGNEIPIVTGFTSKEGLVFYPDLKHDPQALLALENCAYMVPKELVTDRNGIECLELGKKLKEAHVKGDEANKLNCLLDILAFKHFVHPMQRFLLARSKYSNAPTFVYRFDFFSEDLIIPYRLVRGSGVPGVGHGDELAYLFHTIMGSKQDKNSRDYKTIERMTSLFTQFAISGDPNCEALEQLKWKPLENVAEGYIGKCLNISDELQVMDIPEMSKVKVWDSLYSKELL